jgi:hypothetical protein
MSKSSQYTKLNSLAVKIAKEELGAKAVISAHSAQATDSEGFPSIQIRIVVAEPFKFVGSSMARIGLGIQKQADRLLLDRRIYTHFIRQSEFEEA